MFPLCKAEDRWPSASIPLSCAGGGPVSSLRPSGASEGLPAGHAGFGHGMQSIGSDRLGVEVDESVPTYRQETGSES